MITMYPGMPNSPKTTITGAIGTSTSTITVANAAALPDAPNLAVLGGGETCETIEYTVKTGTVLSGITRGVQGTAQDWPIGTTIARNFAEKDYEAMRQNLAALFPDDETAGRVMFWGEGGPETKTIADTRTALGVNDDKLSAMYSAAVADCRVIKDMRGIRNAINTGVLKVAVIGNSITEGANNFIDNVWINKFINDLGGALSGLVDVQWQNFSIGGSTIYNFWSDTYTAPDDFQKPWATNGLSWKQIVQNYAPNMVIMAFGANDVSAGYDSSRHFLSHIIAISDLFNNGKTSICWVPDVLPKAGTHAQEYMVAAFADAMRSNIRGYVANLFDANRLMTILQRGYDPTLYRPTQFVGLLSFNNQPFYNGTLTINFGSLLEGEENATEFWVRYVSSSGQYGLLFRGFLTGGTPTVAVYAMVNNSPVFDHRLSVSDIHNVVISLDKTLITINGSSFYVNAVLHPGNFHCGVAHSANIANSSCIRQDVISAGTPMDEDVFYPDVDGIDGSHINHPSSFGHHVSYYTAIRPFVDVVAECIAENRITYVQFSVVFSNTDAYVCSSSIPVPFAQAVATPVVTGASIAFEGDLTTGERALISINKYDNGVNLLVTDATLRAKLKGKTVTGTIKWLPSLV